MAPQYDDLPALVNSDSDSDPDEGQVAPFLLTDIPANAAPVFFFFFSLYQLFFLLFLCRSTDDRIFGLLVETVQYSTSMAQITSHRWRFFIKFNIFIFLYIRLSFVLFCRLTRTSPPFSTINLQNIASHRWRFSNNFIF
jgi:hypothetical protein